MDIRVLKYFLIIAQEENITKASKSLHITQPTLSRQMKQLEDELGVKLFQRGKHNIILTKEGQIFKRRAKEIVELSFKAKSELIEQDEISGEISIGCCELRSMKELSKVIAAFQDIYPLVKIKLHSGNNEDIKQLLEQGTLDFALLLEPVDISHYRFIRMKEKELFGVLVQDESSFSKRECIIPGDLVGTQVVTIRDMSVHNELRSWSHHYATQMENKATYNSVYNGATFVRESGGALICLKLSHHINGLTFIPLDPPLELHSVLVWKEQNVFSSLMKTFIQFIQDK